MYVNARPMASQELLQSLRRIATADMQNHIRGQGGRIRWRKQHQVVIRDREWRSVLKPQSGCDVRKYGPRQLGDKGPDRMPFDFAVELPDHKQTAFCGGNR